MTRARRAAVAAMLLVGFFSALEITSAPRVNAEQTDCMGGPATIVGDKDATPGDGVIRGTDGNDIIIGTEGPDKIEGGGGDDRICGQGGDDSLVGGDGFDRTNGGPGKDTCESERVINCETGVPAQGSAPPPK
jgi:RTX calcium-binding nonapeptide repeat (4 copies)